MWVDEQDREDKREESPFFVGGERIITSWSSEEAAMRMVRQKGGGEL
jgi:hypothetical protein